MTISEAIQNYGYAAVAIGTFLEGESVLLLASAAASRGHLSLSMVIVCAMFASFAGDQFFFFLGRRYAPWLKSRLPALQERIGRTQALIARHHAPLILAVRFLYGLRIAGPIALGMSGVHWLRFLLLNFVGALIWANMIAYLGYWAGHALSHLLGQIDADEFWGVAAVFISVSSWWMVSHRRKKTDESTHATGIESN